MGQICSCGRVTRDIDDMEPEGNWDDHFPAMSRLQLRMKRNEFWDTRSSNIPEIWLGLRQAVECRRDGDEESCNAIVHAMGCTHLQEARSQRNMFVYDEFGTKYSMPMYLFKEPRNLLENQGLEQVEMKVVDSNEKDHEDEQKPNEEIVFKVRTNIGMDIDVKMKQQQTIEDLKEYLSEQLNHLDPKRIRIIARGRMLSNEYKIIGPFPIKNGDIIMASFPASLYKAKNNEGQ